MSHDPHASGVRSDGVRLTRSFCKDRYFIYVILQEIAHAVKNHLSPRLDHLSPDEAEAQDEEATDQAIHWFNAHARMLRDQLPLNRQEITQTEEVRQQARFDRPCR